MKFFVILFFLLGVSVSHAQWNAEYFLTDENTEILQDVDYQSLKAKVCHSLKNSWCTTEKARLLMDLTMVTKPKVCVEIGAFTGTTVLPVAATLKILNEGKIYCVDAWSNAVVCRYMEDNDPNKNWWATVDMKAAFRMFERLIDQWSLQKVCLVVPKTSLEAAKEINEIDFLNIDGDYSPQGSMEDVLTYVPKVKSGGYILFSNLYVMVNAKQTKVKAFCKMFESCELICLIDQDNTVLFKKK